ncbi:hypothetical protein DRZ78_03500 [Candidatus Aerophobetes bacterium]|uniref:Uncharacterized protein n=1 Tax=Aerophobetes bacterium TaxID=2030807 RepID=A0A662D3X1_UNCAE|nr:MAG: hypothetical protein DRZ78_03500 [Candidatus Aerophobetes bacterium]
MRKEEKRDLRKDDFLTLSEASSQLGLSYRHTYRLFLHLVQARMNPDLLLYKRITPPGTSYLRKREKKVIKVFEKLLL